MRKELPRILVTGGAGFIGSAFVRLLLRGRPRSMKGLIPQEAIAKDTKGTVPEMLRDCPRQSYSEVFKRGLSLKDRVIVVDKLTYAADLERLKEVEGKYKFYKADICDSKRINAIFQKERPGIVINFSAETHVDRSILDSEPFIKTNVTGVQVLLDISRKHNIKKFIQISSDEVYGEIKKGSFTEESPLKPNSPYAASKAAADLIIRSYIRTYNFPAIIIRPCNNYGPWQYPEKLIPVIIAKAFKEEKIPIYAQGQNVREWLHVSDCAGAVFIILKNGGLGEVYNVGSAQEEKNIDTARVILKILGKPASLIEFVKDRPGHDCRYALDSRKIRRLGWKLKYSFIQGLELTVNWYLKNTAWWQKIRQKEEYRLYFNKWYLNRH